MDVSSSHGDSSETILNFSMQVKARIPLHYNTKDQIGSNVLEDKINFKNKYNPQVLINNWYEEQLQSGCRENYFKITRGPHATTYDVEFQVPYNEDLEAFNKSRKGKQHKLMTYYKNPTEYSVNFYRVKIEDQLRLASHK